MIRLRPAPHTRTAILSYSLVIKPAKNYLHWQYDPLGNQVARLIVPEKTQDFVLEVDLLAELTPRNPFDFFLDSDVQAYPFQYTPALARDLIPYSQKKTCGPLLRELVERLKSQGTRPTVSFLIDVNAAVQSAVGYISRFEQGVQTPEQTLERQSGSCRDSAWLLVVLLRQLGIAARFVSGYLIQLQSEDERATTDPGTTTDSTDLHAWAEVYLPGAGWIGLDPTSGLLTAEGHIPLACTPEPADAAAVDGTVEPSTVEFSYSMAIRRLEDSPRAAAPISDAQWAHVRQLAVQVDADLLKHDVRLTMGGEPTYVGLDEPDSPQWNGAALGPLKRERSVVLIKRLRERMAPNAMLHFGQGKWYPGEPLPRWAFNCYWRADGLPIWENTQLIAEDGRDYGYKQGDALTFLTALAQRLQVSATNILPAFEDALYYIWRERKLPVNVDVLESKLNDAQEREELARIFTNGLEHPVGYVLPLRRRQHEGRIFWSSQLWFFRPQRVHC